MKRKDLEEVFDDTSSPFTKSRRLDADLIGAMNEDQSSACEVFQQRLPQDRPLKRKGLGEVLDDLSSPSSKSRRLDAELFSKMKEDQISGLEPLACTSHMQKGGLPMDSLPLPSGDEKALVLYSPAKMPFYKTPASKDFSIIVNSNLIPGLRDQIFTGGNLKSGIAVLDGVVEEKSETSNDCWAVVPWVKSTWPLASRTETHAASLSEAQEVEMMDTDDNGYNGSNPSEFGAMMDGSVGIQQWQQQQQLCMQPQLLNNTSTPITW